MSFIKNNVPGFIAGVGFTSIAFLAASSPFSPEELEDKADNDPGAVVIEIGPGQARAIGVLKNSSGSVYIVVPPTEDGGLSGFRMRPLSAEEERELNDGRPEPIPGF